MNNQENTLNETIIINGKILTMERDEVIDNGYVWLQDGKIKSVGAMDSLKEVPSIHVVDAMGGFVLPGFIDAHSHMGISEESGIGEKGEDGNEVVDPIVPQLRGIDAVNPMDIAFSEALNAGITTVVTGPGSGAPIGGQLFAMKTHGRQVDKMVIQSPIAMKLALGENPKSVGKQTNSSPYTRMATAALIREHFKKADEYDHKIQNGDSDKMPDFNIKLEALSLVTRKEIPAHIHAHRADDIFTATRLSYELGIDYVIVHGTEAHLIADELAEMGATVITGPHLVSRSKPEVMNLSFEGPAILNEKGVKIAICADHPVIPQKYLPLLAGLAVKHGLPYDEALKAITIYPAEILGLEDQIGSIAEGKDGDIVVYDRSPLDLQADTVAVFVNGCQIK